MTEPKTYNRAQRMVALGYGMLCHLLFVAAIVAMAAALFSGLRIGLGPFRGWAAALANLLLLSSFPLLHSWLLSARGRGFMSRLVPMGIGKELSTTVFAALSSLQLLAIFLLWSPSGVVWWEGQGWIKIAIAVAAGASWLLLGKSMADAQLGLQTGFLGWGAVYRNGPPKYKPFATKGVYRHVRQPIYISFALLLWLSATWTPDQLVLALLWTSYCVVGSVLKEKRYLKHFGQAFKTYQQRVPFWLPRLTWGRSTGHEQPIAKVATDTEVLIAGGGPVGLLLANLLGQQGRSVMVVERRTKPPAESMAIGITPPSLDILRGLDLDQTFAACGIPIQTARVFEHGNNLGAVDFSRLPTEHRYILSLPQAKTVEILRHNLRAFPSVKLLDGVEVVGQRDTPQAIHVQLRDRVSGALSEMSAQYLAGCDGHRSQVRRQAHIRSRSRVYASRFLMADFEDATDLGGEAHLYFGPKGSVESFPLPGGQRRWIILQKTREQNQADIAEEVQRCVRERTGHDLSRSSSKFQSAFQPNRVLARHYARGRVVLCGDAAHVMSPIGGQGMNTGFADAVHLADTLDTALQHPQQAGRALDHYTLVRKHAFQVAANRAARGMWLGTRPGVLFSGFRRLLITHVLFRPSVRERLAPYFAMLTIPQAPGVGTLLAGAGESPR